MEHRHLNINPETRFSLAALDDIISRGKRHDWAELYLVAVHDQLLREKIRQICAQKVEDPYEQRYHFWMNYVRAAQEQ